LQYHFVHHKSAWTYLGANPGFRDEKLATNRLHVPLPYKGLRNKITVNPWIYCDN
jgi:hypothetical protein